MSRPERLWRGCRLGKSGGDDVKSLRNRLLRRIFLLVALAFMACAMVQQWEAISRVGWTFRSDLLTVAIGGVVLVFLLDAYGWHLTLVALGQRIRVADSIRIWLVSSLARYVPGGIWAYAGRIHLAKEAGIGAAPAALSLTLETLLLIGSSFAAGFPSLLAGAELPLPPYVAVVAWIAFGFLLHPRALSQLRRLPGRLGSAFHQIALPQPRQMLFLYLYYLVFWLAFGLLFDCFVAAFYPLPPQAWLPVGSSLAMGFFVGFVAVVVPAGIGVRESVMYLLLLPYLPPPASMFISVSSRLWIMAGEFLCLALVMIESRIKRGRG